ncbi:MAG: A24 family peptidase [Vicinamibacterales bacterium]
MPAISSPALTVLVAGALVATIVDIRTRRIPNELTATMAGIGVGFAATGVSGVSLWGSMIGFALGLALMMPGHLFGATGAGDVKLMAAIGAILGPALVVSAFLFTAIAGGVLAVAVAARRQRLAATLAGTGKLIAAPGDARLDLRSAASARRFAYGPAIAVGSVLAGIIG